jgi:hypothetical protein
MALLRIQHAVSDFDEWKRVFDSDPIDRRGGGVRRYRIHRVAAEPNVVMIDLELDSVAEADAFLQKLHQLWEGPGRAVMQNPEAWVLETVESADV